MTRDDSIEEFLRLNGCFTTQRAPLAGDASGRRYERLTATNGGTYVLMDAPPDTGERIDPFVRVAAHLSRIGLSAPQIHAVDRPNGLILMEDLGDAILARLIERKPDLEAPLYGHVVETLLELQRHPLPGSLPEFGPSTMAKATDLAISWYATGMGAIPRSSDTEQLADLTLTALASLEDAPKVLALRDFHAENLIWLPDRTGSARIGLLDFQDAFAGHPAYDLVSLLRDARRNVSPDLRHELTRHFAKSAGFDIEPFERACATLAAQRNLRILGVFARLSMHFGKGHYVDLIPRVWAYLQQDLTHPALASLQRFVQDTLPEPTPDRLRSLKDLCGTVPMP
ncbi:hypothetical protein CLV78_11282 [Aliiruegeria haliotis]|uniref:Aminoglycoside phosphotransferase domain-containing protein n=1 Tax=Aliiruegeria haliotis TaxID=1280846 RepID=A0A2T0RHT3_9RHOB|nr:phosphotransferase [Aliiruegeria haliotis]PRY20709.1 hypothetical protein CLV78_11282 [Aliiruegeria haliotis]